MAESAVNFVLETLSAPIFVEASLLRRVGHEVENIKLELENMQAFLRDADRRRDSNEELKTWVRQVREAAYDVEVILDEFVYRMLEPRIRGFKSLILRIIRLPKNIYYKHRFATRLQEINENVQKISARRNRYNLNQIEEGTSLHDASEGWHRSMDTAIFKQEDDIIGMKKEFELIVKWLLEGDQRLTVISVTDFGQEINCQNPYHQACLEVRKRPMERRKIKIVRDNWGLLVVAEWFSGEYIWVKIN